MHHSQTFRVYDDLKSPNIYIFMTFLLLLIVFMSSMTDVTLWQILDKNQPLYFHLQQQRLIEYIRQGHIAEALTFAQSELAPRGEENPEFLAELERTMALLAFDSLPNAPPNISELLSQAQRLKTAGELNAAILESLSQGKEAKFVTLIRLMVWGEKLLARENIDFPRVDLQTGLTVKTAEAEAADVSQPMDIL